MVRRVIRIDEAGVRFSLGPPPSVVQWIGRKLPELVMRVRFLPGGLVQNPKVIIQDTRKRDPRQIW